MSTGEQHHRRAEKLIADAEAALQAGEIEQARVYAQLADASSQLALAGAVVLSTDSAAGPYRLAAGGLDV